MMLMVNFDFFSYITIKYWFRSLIWTC